MAGHVLKEKSFNDIILEKTDVPVFKCYQCGKCTAGCPLAAEMDFPPSLILRMLQTEMPDEVEKILSSYSIWVCLSCEMCYTRCPQEIDIPKLMDLLRQESIRRDLIHPDAKDIISFHKAFLDSIKYTGRLFENALFVDYKARSRHFFQDLKIAPKMFLKGKLGLLPHTVKDKKNISRIFSKSNNEEAHR